MRIPRLLTVLIAILALLAAACSSGGDTTSAADTLPEDDSGVDAGADPTSSDDGDVATPTTTPGTDTGPSDPPSDGPAAGGTLRIAVTDIGPLDPAATSLGSHGELVVADLLFDGLTSWDATADELVGALATDWTLSEDHDAWTFTLDPDAVFSDGTPVTAGAVKSSLERLVQADPASLAATRLEFVTGFAAFADDDADEIEGLVAEDDDTLTIGLDRPLFALPAILSSPVYGVVPDGGPQGDGGLFAIVGSGPFVLDEFDDGVLTLLPADAEDVWVDSVEIVAVDSEEIVAAVAEGDGDFDLVLVSHPASHDLDDLSDTFLDVVATPFDAHVYLGLNAAAGALEDADLRAAVIAAVDTEAIVEEVYGPTALPAEGLVPGWEACGDKCGGDPEAAAALLEGFDGDVPQVTIDYIDDDEFADEATIARLVADQLIDAGIPVKLRSWSVNAFVDRLVGGDLQVFRRGWVSVGTTPESYLGRYETGGLDNLVGVSSRAVDDALESARDADSLEEAEEAYASAEEAVLATGQVLPLADFVTLVGVGADVNGLTVRADGTFDASALWISPRGE
ncbi:MAG: ABC transporter substrate-binding protein [Acidimicrobiales bacterium]